MDDAHPITVSLVTLGDPATLTGGYLYHRRIARRAAAFPSWDDTARMLFAELRAVVDEARA
jgi:hypothetical protein